MATSSPPVTGAPKKEVAAMGALERLSSGVWCEGTAGRREEPPEVVRAGSGGKSDPAA